MIEAISEFFLASQVGDYYICIEEMLNDGWLDDVNDIEYCEEFVDDLLDA